VADEASVQAASAAIGQHAQAIDVLLNNAGIGDRATSSLGALDWAQQHHVYEVNTLGPLRVTRALLPLLRRGTSPRIVNMTSLMGSIADNQSGGAYGYRMSKAALNMATRNVAHELGPESIVCIAMHPGWVRTDMGGPRAPLDVAEAIASMIRTIDGLSLAHSGTFLDRNGEPLPW
jgi:NAD(P)-dependent dehydrogenase (short-subunit alcohol dehydrogenase family)